MAHQENSLPWAALCMNFEYRKAASTPGPQHADLFPRDNKPDLLKSIEYFAQSFRNKVCEHAQTHRARHYTREEYARRARSWTTSVRDFDVHSTSCESKPVVDAPTSLSPDNIRKQRNLELRSLQATLLQGWAAQPEFRKVYPDFIQSAYGPYIEHPLNKDLQLIDLWVFPAPPSSDYYWNMARSTLQRSDILKILFVAAADLAADDRAMQDNLIDTLFLLVHHPSIRFTDYNSNGLVCCMVDVGLLGLINRVAECYIYLNMLAFYHDRVRAASQPLSKGERAKSHASTRRSRYDSVNPIANGRLFALDKDCRTCGDSYSSLPHGLRSDTVPINPQPAYTKLRSFRLLRSCCCRYHEYRAENALFLPFFFPFKFSLNPNHRREEADVLADPERLKCFLKKLWKILVFYEMIYNDVELNRLEQQRQSGASNAESSRPRRLNWEFIVLSGISNLWDWYGTRKIFGQLVGDYAAERWPGAAGNRIDLEEEDVHAASTT